MIIHPASHEPVVSLKRFGVDAEYLEGILRAEKIAVPATSILADAIAVAKQLGKGEVMASLPRQVGKAAGLSYLVRLIAETTKRDKLPHIRKHLRYLADAKANPLPTAKAAALQPRNMVFELEVACLAACCGLEIAMADEPDVRIAGAQTWDMACKAVSSENPVTVADRVEEGIAQTLRFDGEYGLVALGIANRIGHEELMPLVSATEDLWGSFASFDLAAAALQSSFKAVMADIEQQAVTRFDNGKKDHKFRGALLIGHAACGVGGVPALLSSVALVQRHDFYNSPPLEGPERQLAERLNTAAHAVFWG